MKIKNKPSKRKSIDDSSMECREKGISKIPCATFPLAMSNTNKPVINSTCLQQKGDPIDKAVGTNIGLSMGNTIAKGTPLPKDLSIKCDKRGTIIRDLPTECDKGGTATLQITGENVDIIDPYSLKTFDILGIPPEYNHLGQCTCVCRHCGAMFWECKKVASTSHTSQFGYNKCCYGGRIILRPPPEYPQYIKELYENIHFMDNIRAYNQMFSMTSLGANVDKSINNGKGPYVFRISGQLYHWIGSLCLEEGQSPRVDRFLDSHNALVQLFRTAHNKHIDADIPEFKVRLYNVIETCQYELPTSETIGAIVFADSSTTENEFDLIIKQHSQFPQRNYIQQKQDDIRSEYLSGIYDAILRGDRDGSDLGLRTILRQSALYPFPQLTVADRADIVDRVFEKKVRDYIAFVRESKTFGTLVGARCNAQKLIFVYGHGETGKTFLWKAVISALRSEEKIVLTVAASALDRSLKDIYNTLNTFFGCKSIMLGGDFRQTLPVKKKASKPKILDASITSSYLWPKFKDLQKKAIVCPKNEDADMIDAEILTLVNHQQHVYLSFDEAVPHGNDRGETELLYPTEYLNSLNFAGFPPHRLELKVEANDPNIISTDKGKLPLVEANSVSIADINPTLLNQTIEVRVYRKWVAKNVATQVASNFCAILLEKQGNAMQANMDLKDTDYFSELLQLNDAYRFSRFRCTPTKAWERTLQNDITLTLGRYTSIVPISNANFPKHYFNFVAYNEVDHRATKSGAPLTGLQLSLTSATHYYLNPNIPEAKDILNMYCFKAIINDETATATVTCFSQEAHTFMPDCNTIVNTIEDKDTTHVPIVLTQTEGHTYIFQYRFGQQAKPGYLKFTLDAVLQPLTKPLLALPAAETIKSPATQVFEETSVGNNPATANEGPSESGKPDVQSPSQIPEEKAKKTRRGLFQDTDT
nr:helitron helicase-like domain-containing protein [Tanacetum cinerariifolium]